MSTINPLRAGDPTRIGPFRIAGRLGAGGMGTVFAGTDSAGMRVAVKRVHVELAEDPDFRARFHREVQVLKRIHNDCLVPLLDADAGATIPWLATPYVPGLTLQQHLQVHGPLSGIQLHLFAAGCATALAVVHDAGIVHRDLKPGNVILSPDGPRVLDFGIAHTLDGTAVTRTGVMTGTPGWISPEQYRDGSSGPAADVFSLGALIAYATTGHLPFGEGPAEAVAVRVMTGRPHLDGVPDELRGVVESALAKEPSHRPPASAVAEQTNLLLAEQATHVLGPLSEQETIPGNVMATQWHVPTIVDDAWPTEQRGSGRRTRMLAAVGVVTALVAAGVAWGVLHAAAGSATATGSAGRLTARQTQDPTHHTPLALPTQETAPVATTTPTAAAAGQTSAATQVLTFSPWDGSGQPAPSIVVTAQHNGHCWEQAMGTSREDAWRCSDNKTGEISDPCFANSAQTQLLCPTNDELTRMVLLTPDGLLPDKPASSPTTIPLALQLANGQMCRTAIGGGAVPPNVAGQPLTYLCPDGELYGLPTHTSPTWTVTYRPTGSAYSDTQTVTVALM